MFDFHSGLSPELVAAVPPRGVFETQKDLSGFCSSKVGALFTAERTFFACLKINQSIQNSGCVNHS